MSEVQQDSGFEIHEVYDEPTTVITDHTVQRAGLIGKILIGCFLCPMMVFSILGGGNSMLFFWDLLGSKSGALIVWALIPLLAGVLALVFRRTLKGSALTGALAATGLAGLSVLSFLDLQDEGAMFGSALTVNPGAGWVFLVFLLSALTIAIGNKLRKEFPEVKLSHGVMCVGGVLFTSLFFLPFVDGDMAVSFLFSSRAWSVDAFGNFLLLVILGYGITAALAPLQLGGLEWTRTGVVVVHRLALFGLPIGILLARNADASGYEAAFTGGSTMNLVFWALKVFSLFYGLMALSYVGAKGWFEIKVHQRLESAEG